MASFSERQGLVVKRMVLQTEGMDDELRVGLWNVLTAFCWRKMEGKVWLINYRPMQSFCYALWVKYFKRPVDTIDSGWNDTYAGIREHFFNCSWNGVYDFVEFVVQEFQFEENKKPVFVAALNHVLQRELSGFRVIGDIIAPVSAPEEVAEIERAMTAAPDTVRTHLETAVRHLSDRKSPDFRNSIKESISAIESLAKRLTGNKSTGLAAILRQIGSLHPALRQGFEKLYGYTSDASGIRHALLDDSTSVGFDEAKFMAVTCSAFVNYVLCKTR